jgi:hypothetical protein
MLSASNPDTISTRIRGRRDRRDPDTKARLANGSFELSARVRRARATPCRDPGLAPSRRDARPLGAPSGRLARTSHQAPGLDDTRACRPDAHVLGGLGLDVSGETVPTSPAGAKTARWTPSPSSPSSSTTSPAASRPHSAPPATPKRRLRPDDSTGLARKFAQPWCGYARSSRGKQARGRRQRGRPRVVRCESLPGAAGDARIRPPAGAVSVPLDPLAVHPSDLAAAARTLRRATSSYGKLASVRRRRGQSHRDRVSGGPAASTDPPARFSGAAGPAARHGR